jgi:histidine triad (HIT) family protein
MGKQSVISLLLSLLIPGLGHIYAGKGNKGTAIFSASILISSLNILFILFFKTSTLDLGSLSWKIIRTGHLIIAIWSFVFWIWVLIDSYQEAIDQIPALRKMDEQRILFWRIAMIPAFSLMIVYSTHAFLPQLTSAAFISGKQFYSDVLLVYIIPTTLLPSLVAFTIALFYPVVNDMPNALKFALPVFIVHLIIYFIYPFTEIRYYTLSNIRHHLIFTTEFYLFQSILLFACAALLSRLGTHLGRDISIITSQPSLQHLPIIHVQKSKPISTFKDNFTKHIYLFFYSVAKTWMGGLILHWVISNFSFAIPIKKLINTNLLIAFHHPVPAYPLHILIVPKSKLRSLKDLPTDERVFESSLFLTVNALVQLFDLDTHGYRLIANGGSAQEVVHLHFHLISEKFVGD